MTISLIVAIVLLYRYYLYTRKRNDRKRMFESRKIYLRDFFQNHFAYFSLLDEAEKQDFIFQTLDIEMRKNIFGKTTAGLDEHLKLLICATFVQITFKLEEFKKEEFLKFFLHPSIFFNRLFHNQIRLRSSVVRNIHISWEDYNRGYMFSPEKLKLAIYELSHSLHTAYFGKQAQKIPEYSIWLDAAGKEMKKINEGDLKGLFTKDEADDHGEFFAACSVHFFQDPLQLRDQYMDLYRTLVDLLKQDMAMRVETMPKVSASNV
jgi:Mlc titration factor MtfA (ptsG expression regulator)